MKSNCSQSSVSVIVLVSLFVAMFVNSISLNAAPPESGKTELEKSQPQYGYLIVVMNDNLVAEQFKVLTEEEADKIIHDYLQINLSANELLKNSNYFIQEKESIHFYLEQKRVHKISEKKNGEKKIVMRKVREHDEPYVQEQFFVNHVEE